MRWQDDLREDYQDLAALAMSFRNDMEQFASEAERVRADVRPRTIDDVFAFVASLRAMYEEIEREAAALGCSCGASFDSSHDGLAKKKRDLIDRLRSIRGIAASVAVSLDWQSPAFAHSRYSQAGIETGKINATFNDYKRDFHGDARRFERAFDEQFLHRQGMWRPNVRAVSSGMAAFTTALEAVFMSNIPRGPVLIGSGTYFQSKAIVERLIPDRIEINEADISSAVEAVRAHAPSLIILDTLCNTEGIIVPPLRDLLCRISAHLKKPTAVIFDNTGFGPAYNPVRDIPRGSLLRPVVFESLAKYYQHGMDRVTGGILWAPPWSGFDLFSSRMHLGTNIPDASVRAIPAPNRGLLLRRFQRFERNALWLAQEFDRFARSHRTLISHVNYPGLRSHPAFDYLSGRPFHGSFFTVTFRPMFRHPKIFLAWLRAVVKEAKKDGLDVCAGSSFGFDTTRVYLTALHADHLTRPFVRVSAGTETCVEIKKICEALKRASKKTFGLIHP